MTTFTLKSPLRAIESYLKASGWFAAVHVGEQPSLAPGPGIQAVVTVTGLRTAFVTTAAQQVWTVRVKLYRDVLADPAAQSETDLARAVSEISEDLLGEFDLGGSIRNVDAANLSARWGHETVARVMYRVAVLTVPLIVNDSGGTLTP